MMRSLFSAVSGLKSHQTRMDVIGNNIANVNTTGFKSSRVTFADQLSQTLSGASKPADNGSIGGTNPKQVGLGVGVQGTDLLFTDSSVQGTGKNTDLALSGNALFVVKKGKMSTTREMEIFPLIRMGIMSCLGMETMYKTGWQMTKAS